MTRASVPTEQGVTARLEEADRRVADAEALLDIASAQLSVAARNIANANRAEREYRRATWHYTRLMQHQLVTPLDTIVELADSLRDLPDLEATRRQALAEAIGEQARVLRDLCRTRQGQPEAPQVEPLRPVPLTDVVRALGPRGGA